VTLAEMAARRDAGEENAMSGGIGGERRTAGLDRSFDFVKVLMESA
jgi:hypothetical protein